MTLRLVRPAPQPAVEYEHRACHVCHARMADEARRQCVSASDATGERWCVGAAREEPDDEGRLMFPTAGSIVALEAWIDAEITREMQGMTL